MSANTKTDSPSPGTAGCVRFGTYEVDFRAAELRKNGLKIKLHSQPLAVLQLLLERPGEVVTREELQQRLWGSDTFVDFEQGLNKAINKLREALSDNAETPRFIETLPRRGYRFIGPVAFPDASPAAPAAPQPSQPFRFWKRALVAGVVIFITAAVYWFGWRNHSPRPAPATRAMLAVLPFENLSGDIGEDYFSDGLTEEMIAQLGQLRPSSLGVIARTSSMHYKHTQETVAQIGSELGVNYVLEGSVRRAGQRVRITAQLIQAGDQTHLWAESYETPVTDILKIQTEIAGRITRSLQLELLPGHASEANNLQFDPEAHRKYLLALNEFRSGTREGEQKAIQDLRDAIAADPKNGRLYAALAEVYAASHTYFSSPREVMPQAEEAALKALELDPNLASAHATLGYVSLFFDWDWKRAEAEYLRALEINPSLPDAQLGYASYLATLGRFDEAISRVQQTYLVDPLATDSRKDALWIYYFSGRMPDTIAQAQKTIEMEPQAGLPHAMLALAHADLGHRLEALREADAAVRLSEGSPSEVAIAASAMARAGDRDKARQTLEHALDLAKTQYVCRFIVANAYLDLAQTEQAWDSLELAFRQRST